MVLPAMQLDLPGYVLLLSTLPTLATTILRARCTMRLRTGSTGLVQCTFRRMPTTCTSVAALSIRRSTALVASVAPYAAPRSRVDSTMRLDSAKTKSHLSAFLPWNGYAETFSVFVFYDFLLLSHSHRSKRST